MLSVELRDDAARAVRKGHPWVFQDAVRARPELGSVVALTDRKGKQVGWGIADEGAIAIRVLPEDARQTSAFLKKWIGKADALRVRLIPSQTSCYRVCNGPGDGLPGIVVDRYGSVAVLRLYSAAWERHLKELVATLSELPWVESVYRRYGVKRVDGRRGGEVLKGPAVPSELVVEENGVRFLVRLEKGQKTGLFLDQRANRQRIGQWSSGRRVFNLFGYNGGFSLYAALGGASRVETVDVSAAALEDAKENFRLNGLDPSLHAFHAVDVFRWDAPGKAGLVICDPPSLTHGQANDSSARQAYKKLNARVAGWVTHDGLLASASCTARLSAAQWESAVFEGISAVGEWAILARSEAPVDHPVAIAHPEGRYLKFALLSRI